jgi:pilus assembly protein Flp/PilA
MRPRARFGERGASAVEYAILVAGIAAVIALVVYALGDDVTRLFEVPDLP